MPLLESRIQKLTFLKNGCIEDCGSYVTGEPVWPELVDMQCGWTLSDQCEEFSPQMGDVDLEHRRRMNAGHFAIFNGLEKFTIWFASRIQNYVFYVD